MEVATIITNHKEVFGLFGKFLHQYPSLSLYGKDDDTEFFEWTKNKKVKLFYHYILEDPEKEFSYNYSDDEIIQIKERYKTELYMCYLSYSTEELLENVLSKFIAYLKIHGKEFLPDISISHPFDGLKSLIKSY